MTDEEANRIILDNMPIVWSLSKKFYNSHPGYCSYGSLEDVQQELFLNLFRYFKRYDMDLSRVSTYMFLICKTKLIRMHTDYVNKCKGLTILDDPLFSCRDQDVLEDSELIKLILAEASPDMQVALKMLYVGYTRSAIERKLGLSRGVLGSKLKKLGELCNKFAP